MIDLQPLETIDVVVPVFGAVDDLRGCVDSVLQHSGASYRLLLIDDASPGPDVLRYFDELRASRLEHVELLRNDANLGFTRTANRGMRASSRDVVLLNSDTVVTAGWLDALRRCAASDPTIGTITPFSNNAEICSYPRLCENDGRSDPAGAEAARAALADAAVPTYPDLPTGVGFCLYVRRAMLDAIGVFDEVFGIGYGEENDLCLRAAAAGWRNVLADDAFVVHLGERSFSGQKAELGPRNLALLVERHPHYLSMVRDYIDTDPLRALREAAVSRERVMHARGLLHVIHHHGGGTERHVRALIAASRERWRHYLAIAVGDSWQIEEHREDGNVVTFAFTRCDDQPWPAFVGGLCGTFGIDLIHLHNISACRQPLLEALSSLKVPFGYTVHDLNFACPTITFLARDGLYCGAVTNVEACAACLRAQPEFADIDIASWRERHAALLRRAAFLIAPSRWAAETLHRYFPGLRVDLIAHGIEQRAARSNGPRSAVVLPDDDVPTVVVLGAIGPDKGARRLERVVQLARDRDAPVRFVLIGYLDVQHVPWQSDDARFTVHGHYAPEDLPDLLAHYRAALVLYPSAGPETFSYTLSEAWRSGRPALVPPIGALVERVRGSGAGFVMTDAEWRDESSMLDRILSILRDPALVTAASTARRLPHPDATDMMQATCAVYERVVAVRRELPRLPRGQVRDALGYVEWRPPLPSVVADRKAAEASTTSGNGEAPLESHGAGSRVAQAALAIRHTPVGRVLYRLAPRAVVNALKSRLPA